MTAHRAKDATITQAHVEWFARYYFMNITWGVFHVCLDDGNWNLGASDPTAEWSTELVEMAAWFNKLTPSQRRKLGKRAQILSDNTFFTRWMTMKGLPPLDGFGRPTVHGFGDAPAAHLAAPPEHARAFHVAVAAEDMIDVTEPPGAHRRRRQPSRARDRLPRGLVADHGLERGE